MRKWIWGAQLLKQRRLLCEPMFIPIKRRTLILKNGRKRICSSGTRALIHLSQLGEWVCSAQSLLEMRLFCVYPDWVMNFNSRNGSKISFSYETKALISFMPIRRMCLRCPMMKKKRDYYVNPHLPQLKDKLQF